MITLRTRRRVVGAVLALSSTLIGIGHAPPASAGLAFNQHMLELINKGRRAGGLQPVVADARLSAAAEDAPYWGCGFLVEGRAKDMGVRNYFSHTIKHCATQSVFSLLNSIVGLLLSGTAENIAWMNGTTDPSVAAANLHSQLMASPSHRANILNASFTRVGIGSWRTEPGQTWAGGGFPLTNVFIGVQIFAGGPVDAAVVAPPSGARFHPVTPSRLLDTRSGRGPIGPGSSVSMQVTGRGGVPASGVSAVAVNVTTTQPTAPGWLTVWATGEAMPVAANLNFGPGDTVANLVVTKLGAGGQVSVYNSAGTTHVVADVAGWYSTGADVSGARYHPLTPSRVLDTRAAAAVGPAATLTVPVAGRGGIPATGVSAVVLTVTATQPSSTGWLSVFPAGEPLPLAANLNFRPGQTVPNLVVAKVGAGGRVSIHNSSGTTHVVADVAGWYDTGDAIAGVGFHAVTATRLLDTRSGIGAPAAALTPGGRVALQVAGRGGTPGNGVSAVVLNVTAIQPTAAGWLTVFPAGETLPLAANVNFVPGQIVSNLVIAKVGAGGQVSIHNATGSTHLVADLAGWYSQ